MSPTKILIIDRQMHRKSNSKCFGRYNIGEPLFVFPLPFEDAFNTNRSISKTVQ